MATKKDIAKVFYKLSVMEGNSEVMSELLLLMAEDYGSISTDTEAEPDSRERWRNIAKEAKALAELVRE